MKGNPELKDMHLRVPGEPGVDVVDPVLDRITLTSSDPRFETEYLKALDDLRIKSATIDELRKTLDMERGNRAAALQATKDLCSAKDIEIQNLHNALETSCKRTTELEDRLAKAKQRSMVHISNSPITSTPRISLSSPNNDTQQRHSFSGPLSAIPQQRAPIHMSTNILPQYTIASSFTPTASIQGQYILR